MIQRVNFTFLQPEKSAWRKATIGRVKGGLKKALGSNEYSRLSELFFHVHTDKYPNKLLVTRRAYLLYKLFVDIFTFFPKEYEKFGNSLTLYGQIYNSHSMYLLKTVFEAPDTTDKKLLIVDDIIVHGRAVSQICDDLKSEIFVESGAMHFWCFDRSYDARCISEEVENNLRIYKVAGNQEWKNASDAFTMAIINNGMGYTSYIDTYFVYNLNSKIHEVLNASETAQYNVITTESHIQGDAVLKSSVYMRHDAIDKTLRCAECLRFYFYDEENRVLVIPYLFINSVCADQAYNYAILLLRKYGISHIPPEFCSEIVNDTNLVVLFLKWTVNRIGQELVRRFFEDYFNDSTDITIEVARHKETFPVSEETIPIQNQDCIDFKSYENTEDMDLCIHVFEQTVNQFLTSQESQDLSYEVLKEIYTQYAFTIKEKDESDAAAGRCTRHIGIRLEDVYSIIIRKFKIENHLEQQKVLHKLISLFIMQWDTGEAAYNLYRMKSKNGHDFISSFLRNGEQVYKQIYLLYPHAYLYFQEFTKRTLEFRSDKLLEFGTFLKCTWDKKANENLLSENEKKARCEIDSLMQHLVLSSSYFDDAFVICAHGADAEMVHTVQSYISKLHK